MNAVVDQAGVRSILERDRIWCAYGLADLEPAFAPSTEWRLDEDSVVMIYRGLEPPVLFAHGDPGQVSALMEQVPGGRFTFTLLGIHRSRLGDRLEPEWETRMWRMALNPEDYRPSAPGGADRLSAADLAAIDHLFASHPDRPDSFHVGQLNAGVFYGIREEGELISIAGTHILSETYSVAAIGNVFTRPDRRGRGLASRTTAAVVDELLRKGIQTIVLNVGMDNHAAVHLYRKLGFWPFCGYYEGVGSLAPISTKGDN